MQLNHRRLKESFACSHFQKVQQLFQKILLKYIIEYALWISLTQHFLKKEKRVSEDFCNLHNFA